MIKLLCNQIPVGDVRSRQPKQPGQKKALWNFVQTVKRETPVKTYGNICKDGNARCCLCGQKGHDEL